MWNLSLLVWLTSLSTVPSRSACVVANGGISFLFVAEWCSIVCVYHIFLVYVSTEGHLGCFRSLSIVDDAAVSTVVYESF